MARVTSQVKSTISLLASVGGSICWGTGAKRFFDTPQKSWVPFAVTGVILLIFQIGLIFVESREDEEFSLARRQRMAALGQSIEEAEQVSTRIQLEIKSGNLESAQKWAAFRKDQHGK